MKRSQYSGRCFIIGTGPSLREMHGLERLEHEDTFGTNKLELWSELPFTPTYYCCNFTEVYSGYSPREPRVKRERFLFKFEEQDDFEVEDGWTVVTKRVRESFSDMEMRGLDDVLEPIPGGGTIPLTVAQLALYMGYRELYFLGVDQSDGTAYDPNQRINRHGPEGVNSIKWKVWPAFKEYCESNGVRVRDCTPGGGLNHILEYESLGAVLQSKSVSLQEAVG